MRDVRFALRLLRRQPGFTSVVLLTLALGIGASTAIFSVVDAAVLRPLPYPDPDQLVTISIQVTAPEPMRLAPSTGDLRSWIEDSGVFSSVAIWRDELYRPVVELPGPERVSTRNISEDYLELFGAAPARGRRFTLDDMQPGAPLVVMIGHDYWQTRFGGSAEVLGQTLRLNEGVAQVVGVLPAGFHRDTHLWRPFREPSRRGSGANVYGRLRPGVTVAGPTEVAKTVDATLHAEPLLADVVSTYSTTAKILSGAVALVLIIASVNVAGLLLARGASRRTEMAVRASLGAGRGRLVRQLLAESLLLALAGGAIGIIVAWLGLDVIVANLPLELRPDAPATMNGAVLLFGLVVSAVTGVAFGLVPALRLSRTHAATSLTAASHHGATAIHRRTGGLVIAAEVALAVILLLGGTLMLRSFAKIVSVDLGFDPHAILTMEVVPLEKDAAKATAYFTELVARVRAVPMVEHVGAIDSAPLSPAGMMMAIGADDVDVDLRQPMPGYFAAMGQRVIRGRTFTNADQAGAKVAILSEKAARGLFKTVDAVGQTVTLDAPYEVIGVVADIRNSGPLRPSGGMLFLPFGSLGVSPQDGITVVVRPRGSAANLAGVLHQTAESLGTPVLVERIRSGAAWVDDRIVTPRRRTVLLSLLGGLGLAVAVVGVFGITAYAVTRRVHEIGIRVALGATPARVVGGIVGGVAPAIGAGILGGLGIGLVAARAIESFLFETPPTDALSFVVVGVVVTMTSILAAWLPARRAAGVDPIVALRSE
jgi:putative ABC transport system permease protein